MTDFYSEMRLTTPGPDIGDPTSLQEQGQWLEFAERAEIAKRDAGETHDLKAIGYLVLQNAEDRMDAAAGIESPTIK